MSDEAIANNSEAVAPDSGSESVTDLDSLLSEYDNSATTTTEQASCENDNLKLAHKLSRSIRRILSSNGRESSVIN